MGWVNWIGKNSKGVDVKNIVIILLEYILWIVFAIALIMGNQTGGFLGLLLAAVLAIAAMGVIFVMLSINESLLKIREILEDKK